MKIIVDQRDQSKVAIIESEEIVIENVQDALDLMATVSYQEDCNKILINKSNINEDFFELKTRLLVIFCRNIQTIRLSWPLSAISTIMTARA